MALGAAGALLLGVALLAHVSPAQASGISIRLLGLATRGTISIWDGANIDLSNLDPHQTYEVVVTTSDPTIVGIGDCLGASEWHTFTGSTFRSLRFAIRACTPGQATVTVQVFLAGANSAAASVSQHVTALPMPSVVPHQRAAAERAVAELADVKPPNQHVRNFLAGGIVVQRPFPPRLSGYVSAATATATIVNWATWWTSPPTGGVDIIGFQIRYWPNNEPSRVTSAAIANPNVWQYRLTGLAANTWYTINMRACTNQEDCTAAEWTGDYEFRTLPG